MDWTLFDCEGDGLYPTKIYCLSYINSDGNEGTEVDYDDMRAVLSKDRVLVGHNIIRWDIPTLERILDISCKDSVLIDTLAVAWYLDCSRGQHGLESYGPDFGIQKPKIDDWHNLDLADYINRCERDVELNHKLWLSQLERLLELYPDADDFWNFLRYLEFKMDCAREQERSKWLLDVKRCRKAIEDYETEETKKLVDIERVMPKVPRVSVKSPPKRMYKGSGELSEIGKRWVEFLAERGLPETHDEPVEYVAGYDEPNAGSHDQIKNWLYSLGWVPRTFKYKKDENGNLREIPQINKEHGGGICDSIVDLYPICPDLALLDGLFVLRHRLGLLRGFIRDEVDGKLAAKVAGFTNTLRFKHAEIVNLPKPDRPYAKDIRASLICQPDEEQCGADMSSLEDRIKQHFIYEYDPEYVNQLNSDDYDPHLDLAVITNKLSKGKAGVTKEEMDAYKAGDKSKSKIRGIFKNGNYACQYGAGPPRLVLTCNIDIETATLLHKAYWERNWAIKKVAEDQIVKTTKDGQMWLLNPISGFWYSLRSKKDRFSTLVQGTAAFVFDLWVRQVREKRPQLTAQFHDEIVLHIKKGHREECTALLNKAIQEVNDMLSLNREFSIGIQFGDTYADIH